MLLHVFPFFFVLLLPTSATIFSCICRAVLSHSRETLCRSWNLSQCSSFSEFPSPQQILAILAFLKFLKFHLWLFYSARLLGFDWVSVCTETWEVNLDSCNSHLICFLFSGISVLSSYQLSENYYSMYSVYICSCLRCEGKLQFLLAHHGQKRKSS